MSTFFSDLTLCRLRRLVSRLQRLLLPLPFCHALRVQLLSRLTSSPAAISLFTAWSILRLGNRPHCYNTWQKKKELIAQTWLEVIYNRFADGIDSV